MPCYVGHSYYGYYQYDNAGINGYRGYDKAHDQGFNSDRIVNYNNGCDQGHNSGQNVGYSNSYHSDYIGGHQRRRTRGYNRGTKGNYRGTQRGNQTFGPRANIDAFGRVDHSSRDMSYRSNAPDTIITQVPASSGQASLPKTSPKLKADAAPFTPLTYGTGQAGINKERAIVSAHTPISGYDPIPMMPTQQVMNNMQ